MTKEPEQLYFFIYELIELLSWKLKNMPLGMASKTISTGSKSLGKKYKKLRMNFKRKKIEINYAEGRAKTYHST